MNASFPCPWNDAAAIARQLEAGDRLVVLVGAEAWCTTCQTFKPVFERFAAEEAGEGGVFLWLDLEEHAEFLDEFVPPSLPFLLVYTRGILTHGLILDDPTPDGLAAALAERECIDHGGLPDLHARLSTVDWSS